MLCNFTIFFTLFPALFPALLLLEQPAITRKSASSSAHSLLVYFESPLIYPSTGLFTAFCPLGDEACYSMSIEKAPSVKELEGKSLHGQNSQEQPNLTSGLQGEKNPPHPNVDIAKDENNSTTNHLERFKLHGLTLT